MDEETIAGEVVSPPTIEDPQMASKEIAGGEGHAEDSGHSDSASTSQVASPEQRERDKVNPSPPELQSNSSDSVSNPLMKPTNPSQSKLKSPQLTQAGGKPKGEGKLKDKSGGNEAESKIKKQVSEDTSLPLTSHTISEGQPSAEKGSSSDRSSPQIAATKPKPTRKQAPPNQATKEASGTPAKEQRPGEGSTPTPVTEVQRTNRDTADFTADCEHDEFECRKCRKVVRRDSLPLHTHPKSEVKKPAAPIAKAFPTRKATEGSKMPTVVRASEQSAPSSPSLPPTPIQNPTPKAAVRSSEQSATSSHALPSTPIQNPTPQAAQKPKQQSSTPQITSKPVTQTQATPSSNATTSPKSSPPRLATAGKATPKSNGVSSTTKSTEVASKPPEDTSSKSSSDARDEEQNTSSQLGQVCEDETCDECHQIVRKRCGKCDQVLPQARQ